MYSRPFVSGLDIPCVGNLTKCWHVGIWFRREYLLADCIRHLVSAGDLIVTTELLLFVASGFFKNWICIISAIQALLCLFHQWSELLAGISHVNKTQHSDWMAISCIDKWAVPKNWPDFKPNYSQRYVTTPVSLQHTNVWLIVSPSTCYTLTFLYHVWLKVVVIM